MMKRLVLLLLAVFVVLGYAPATVSAGPREDFVHRFYRDVLGRTPDPEGSMAWSSFLHSHCNAQGFDSMSRGFLDSEEFRSRPHSLTGLVTLLYQTFLGRDPEPAGAAAWAQQFGAARLALATDGFLPSREFQNLVPDRTNRAAVTSVVRRFYAEILERDPEPAGLSAWADYIVATRDLAGAALGFLASKEFEAKPMTFRGYVTILYRSFLGREPDPQGLDAWEAVLRDYMFSVIDAGFLPSKEFQGLEAKVCEKEEEAGFEAALVRCEDVSQPAVLGANCGKDPLAAGKVEINDDGEKVAVKVRGAMANASYAVVFRSLTGSTATERMVGTLMTNPAGNGELEAENVFAAGDTGSGNIVLKRDAKEQFVTGFKVAALEDAKFVAALVRCLDVNQPAALRNCGADPLAAGEAEIDEQGDVEVKVVGAMANASYAVVFRSLTGSTATERMVGTLMTNPAGNGELEIENFFATGDTGSGNIVLERSGFDQFVTGFRIPRGQGIEDMEDR